MKTKTLQLDELFAEWEAKTPMYKDKFVRDGIIDEDEFQKIKPKLLFITKEPNNPDQTPDDFRLWWQKSTKYAFSYRIAEWSFGILNKFPEFDSVWKNNENNANDAIKRIAFMNIKKIGGGGSSKLSIIKSHLEMNLSFLHRQIDIIEPDIIITGISWSVIRNILFPDIKWKDSGYSKQISKFNNYKVIDFYHPSSRNAPAAAYSLLQNIIQSDSFKNL